MMLTSEPIYGHGLPAEDDSESWLKSSLNNDTGHIGC